MVPLEEPMVPLSLPLIPMVLPIEPLEEHMLYNHNRPPVVYENEFLLTQSDNLYFHVTNVGSVGICQNLCQT